MEAQSLVFSADGYHDQGQLSNGLATSVKRGVPCATGTVFAHWRGRKPGQADRGGQVCLSVGRSVGGGGKCRSRSLRSQSPFAVGVGVAIAIARQAGLVGPHTQGTGQAQAHEYRHKHRHRHRVGG